MPELKGLAMKESNRSGSRLQAGNIAPDFTLTDTLGKQISLSDYHRKSWVFLVFNRGFA